MVPPDMLHEQYSEGKFRLGKSECQSRRCGGPYLQFARGARQGAPEALQTADRFHVLRNLAAVVEKVRGLASSGVENDSSGNDSGIFCLSLAAPSSSRP